MALSSGNRVSWDLKPFDNSAMANGFLAASQHNFDKVGDFLTNFANMNVQQQTIPYAMAKLEDEYKRNQYNFKVGEANYKHFQDQLAAHQWIAQNWDKIYDKKTGRFRQNLFDFIPMDNPAILPMIYHYAKGFMTEGQAKTGIGLFGGPEYVENPVGAVSSVPAANNTPEVKGTPATGSTPTKAPSIWSGAASTQYFPRNSNVSSVSVTTPSPIPSNTNSRLLNTPDLISGYQAEINNLQNQADMYSVDDNLDRDGMIEYGDLVGRLQAAKNRLNDAMSTIKFGQSSLPISNNLNNNVTNTLGF